MNKKIALRKQMLELRNSISFDDINKFSYDIAMRFLKHPLLEKPLYIGSYKSFAHEVNTEVVNFAIIKDHTLALPVITDFKKSLMEFAKFNMHDKLQINSYGILEPILNVDSYIDLPLLDILIVPLLAFDKDGNRLGMGGGFYDRILKKLDKKCVTVGFSFSSQQIENVPTNIHDVPLDEIITEKEHIIFNKKY